MLLLFIVQQGMGILSTKKMIAEYLTKSPLYGIYRIDQAGTPRKTIPENWRLIVFEIDNNKVLIRNTDYSPQRERCN